jgi:hypothetical protein
MIAGATNRSIKESSLSVALLWICRGLIHNFDAAPRFAEFVVLDRTSDHQTVNITCFGIRVCINRGDWIRTSDLLVPKDPPMPKVILPKSPKALGVRE